MAARRARLEEARWIRARQLPAPGLRSDRPEVVDLEEEDGPEEDAAVEQMIDRQLERRVQARPITLTLRGAAPSGGFSVDVRVSTSDNAAAVRGKLLEALPRLKGPALSLSLRGEALEEGAALSACGVQDGDAIKVSSRAWRKPRAATVTVALGARELTVPIDASTTVRGLQRAVKAQPASCSQTFIQETQ